MICYRVTFEKFLKDDQVELCTARVYSETKRTREQLLNVLSDQYLRGIKLIGYTFDSVPGADVIVEDYA